MPVFNAGRYLRLAVSSIVSQSFADWELLIIDDGSTDDAIAGITDIADPRIRVIRNPRNLGLAATLNVGIDLARGEYFARMDQDDVSYPQRLARQVEILESDRDLDLVGVRCLAIDADNRVVGALPFVITHEALCASPWRGFYLPHPTWMGRIGWFRRHRYASPGPYLCEDQELLLRSYRSSSFATIPEILFAYRVRGRIDWRKAFRTRRTVMWIQVRHFAGMRQWHFASLAVIVFFARVAIDARNVLARLSGRDGAQRYHAVPADTGELERWQGVLGPMKSAGTKLE